MKNIVIIFGGKSVEHEISILTALHAAQHAENSRVILVYITRDNRFVTGNCLADIDWHINKRTKGTKSCWFAEGALFIKRLLYVKRVEVDAVLNCCHGGIGENGELAAMLNIASIPLVSCRSQAAMETQSKTRTREMLTAAGFTQPKFFTMSKGQTISGDLLDKLGGKVIVKPDSLGSSIGISVAVNQKQLTAAVELALSLDKKIIIEEYIESRKDNKPGESQEETFASESQARGMREINCSAFRQGDEVMVSDIEILESGRAILDFEKKYLEKTHSTGKKAGGEAEERQIDPATEKIKELTKSAYELFQCSGVVRVDFMVADEKIYLTEINTVPGFLAYHLWAKTGMPYGVLIDTLINQACKETLDDEDIKTVYESEILETNRALVKTQI